MNLWCCVLHLDSLEPSYLPSGYPHQQRTGLPYKPVTFVRFENSWVPPKRTEPTCLPSVLV